MNTLLAVSLAVVIVTALVLAWWLSLDEKPANVPAIGRSIGYTLYTGWGVPGGRVDAVSYGLRKPAVLATRHPPLVPLVYVRAIDWEDASEFVRVWEAHTLHRDDGGERAG